MNSQCNYRIMLLVLQWHKVSFWYHHAHASPFPYSVCLFILTTVTIVVKTFNPHRFLPFFFYLKVYSESSTWSWCCCCSCWRVIAKLHKKLTTSFHESLNYQVKKTLNALNALQHWSTDLISIKNINNKKCANLSPHKISYFYCCAVAARWDAKEMLFIVNYELFSAQR